MELKTSFYNVNLAEENRCYAILYKRGIYLFDGKGGLLRVIDTPVLVDAFESADFYERFCYYRDDASGEWGYSSYEGTNLLMSDGMTPEEIVTLWGNNGHVMYRTSGGRLYVEEYTADGDLLKFNMELSDTIQSLEVSYSESGYVMVNQDCGEQVQSPYTDMTDLLPVYEKSLYYRGELIATGKGMNLDYMYDLSDGYGLWIVQTGDTLRAESESLYEDYENVYTLADYTMVKEGKVLYEIENAYLVSQCNDAVFLLQGNYVYAVGKGGEVYIRALHTFLNND